MTDRFIAYTVDARTAIADLRAAKGQMRVAAQKGIRKGIRDVAVPRARNSAPRKSGRLSAAIKPLVRGYDAFLSVKTPYAGLIEFGGTRSDVIRPRNAKAVLTPYGPRAAVNSPRTYTGQHFLIRAAQASKAEIADITEVAVLEAFGHYFPIR